ncbi:hypothetical protein [Catellatospora tritici]|uniref:hypothetical protein n=1 Tax=Catellatospora tritici TaxID=2851566 RepID=UPI001C2DCCD3|nr:hypothetical protein [Catellatospora tritici]MBV1853042.1 hypothetical protein [Catellatospora tritici]
MTSPYNSDDESDAEPEYANYAYNCTKCDRVRVLTLDEEGRRSAKTCPQCEAKMVWYKDDDALSRFHTCLIVTCSNYLNTVATGDTGGRCDGDRTDKKGACNKKLEVLTEEIVQALPDSTIVDEDEGDPKPVRQLKALTQQSNAWVKGSGSHHRSTSGAHTSSAREKHSAASGSKDKVRDRFIENLEGLIAEVGGLTATTSSTKAVKEGKAAVAALNSK